MSENSTNELLIRMEEKYKKMSKGQKRLADYVTENSAQRKTLQDLSPPYSLQ